MGPGREKLNVDEPLTTVIEPGDRGRVDALGNLEITVRAVGA
jgi:hypothetical protein